MVAWSWIAGIALLASLPELSGSAWAAPDGARPARYALLIGINDYSLVQDLRSLEGPANDLALLRELLRARFQIPPENIVILRDAQATHRGVRQAFLSLGQRTRAGDFAYIHYSGHGSHKTDENGDELSGYDQTWVTYGARSGQAAGDDDFDVLDDEIHAWLTTFKTDNIVFVSDSCHSGTVFRGEPYGVRSASPDQRPYPFAAQTFAGSKLKRGIWVGAARDTEEAIEWVMDEGKVHGLFTWYWAKALARATPGETWREVFQRAHTGVITHRSARQQPQLTGAGRHTVWGGDFVAPHATVPVRAVQPETNRITLGAGAVAGLTPGSRYRRHGPAAGGEPPSLEITRVDAFSSDGRILRGQFDPGDLVVETEHSYPETPYRLYLDPSCGQPQPAEQDAPLLAGLRQALGEPRGFEWVQRREQADGLVCVLRPRRRHGERVHANSDAVPPPYFTDEAAEAWVLNQGFTLLHERMRVSLRPPADGYRVLADNLRKWARLQALLRLGTDQAALPVTVQARLLREAPTCLEECVTLPFEGHQNRPYRLIATRDLQETPPLAPRRNDVMMFTVYNQGPRDFYVYLLNITQDGDVRAVFPAPDAPAEQARIPAGERRRLDHTGLLLDAVGSEIVKFIVTAQPLDVRLFEAEGYETVNKQRGALNPLERLVAAAMATRAEPMRVPRTDWSSQQAAFSVRD